MQEYDLVIVGGGIGGLTAGLFAVRAHINCILLERMNFGGQILNTNRIENWPGDIDGISGYDLADRLYKHVLKFGLNIKRIEVNSIEIEGSRKIINTSEGKIMSKTVILAVGATPRKLNVLGENEFIGRGVSYCSTCDGPFYKDKVVVVFGGGNTAAEGVRFLVKIASKTYLVHRRNKLKASVLLAERIKNDHRVDILWSYKLVAIEGQAMVETVRLKNLETNEIINLSVDGVFIFVGNKPNTAFLQGILKLDAEGYIVTDMNMRTSLSGVYAIGDCRTSILKQLVIAAGDGAIASYAVQQYLEKF